METTASEEGESLAELAVDSPEPQEAEGQIEGAEEAVALAEVPVGDAEA
jgi:hypothetical protein